jgi:hypothetical protein
MLSYTPLVRINNKAGSKTLETVLNPSLLLNVLFVHLPLLLHQAALPDKTEEK